MRVRQWNPQKMTLLLHWLSVCLFSSCLNKSFLHSTCFAFRSDSVAIPRSRASTVLILALAVALLLLLLPVFLFVCLFVCLVGWLVGWLVG